MNSALEHLKKYCIEKGYEFSNDIVYEILSEANSVWCGEEDHRRWWADYTKVVEINGMLIGFDAAMSTGDMSPKDLGWVFDIDSVKEYTFKEETVVIRKYFPVK